MTVVSFLHLIRMVSLAVRLCTLVKGSNVDNVEHMNILVTMSKCLKRAAMEHDVEAADLRAVLEDELLMELTLRYVDNISEPSQNDYVKEGILYHLCGYMLHARPAVTDCKDCYKSVRCEKSDLPSDFKPSRYTELLNRGNLVFVTPNFFKTFRVVESIVEKHLEQIDQIHVVNSFQKCISKVAKANLIPIFCDIHRNHHLPYLIREYVVVRFHFESKRLKSRMLSQSSTAVKKHSKLSKLA